MEKEANKEHDKSKTKLEHIAKCNRAVVKINIKKFKESIETRLSKQIFKNHLWFTIDTTETQLSRKVENGKNTKGNY